MTHPAVVKATKIANRAVAQGWTGHLDSQVVSDHRKTVLFLNRNDEQLVIDWRNAHFEQATYSIFDSIHTVTDLVQIKQIVMGWPDVIKLLEDTWRNPVEITKVYVRLPFDWETDDDEIIINCLVGKRIWWYESIAAKIRTDEVLPKGNMRVMPVGHRKMFAFKGSYAGNRHVLLDTLLKVS